MHVKDAIGTEPNVSL